MGVGQNETRSCRECEDCGDYFLPYDVPDNLAHHKNGFDDLCSECLLIAISLAMEKVTKAEES